MIDNVETEIHLTHRWHSADQLAGTPLALEADPRPLFLKAPETSLDRRFAAFHAEHPEIYAAYEQRALVQLQEGARRLSISLLTEAIRASAHVPINNSYRAYYSRLLVHDHPELRPMIETRHQHEPRRRGR